MKHVIRLCMTCCFLFVLVTACATPTASPTPEPTATSVPPTPTPAPVDPLSNLHWFGTSAILYSGSQNIYFDPVTLDGTLPTADIILITHAHSDHWSINDLKKIIGPNTTLVISPNVTKSYEISKDSIGIPATVLAEGETTEINGVSVEAVPAFDTRFHLQGSGGVGYVVNVDDMRLYAAGGTASYPEMAQYNCDIAMLPVYDMDDLNVMMDLVPAKVFVLEHTSYYTVKALVKLAAEDSANSHTIAELEPRPFVP